MKYLIITGSNGMLGRCLVNFFKKKNYYIFAIDLSNMSLQKLDLGEFYKLDITSEIKTKKFFQYLNKKINKNDQIDLINCAGIAVFDSYKNRSKKDFMQVLDVNMYGTFNMINNLSKISFKKSTNTSIVNTSSIFGIKSPDYRNYIDLDRNSSEVYGGSKAGVIQMTKYFSVHLSQFNIRVNCISPGGIENKTNPQGPKFQKKYNNKVPLGRMGKNEDLLWAYDYFIDSKKSPYTTGQNLTIDGGYTAW